MVVCIYWQVFSTEDCKLSTQLNKLIYPQADAKVNYPS
jgi:hypothetical protein